MPPDSVRSRSGCVTCRTRKKKCSEDFDANGVCGRCHHGSFTCIRTGKPVRKRKGEREADSMPISKPPTAPRPRPSVVLSEPPSAPPVSVGLADSPSPSPYSEGPGSVSPVDHEAHYHQPRQPLKSPPGASSSHYLSPSASIRNLDPVPLEAIPVAVPPTGPSGPSDELLSFFESLDSINDPGAEVRSLWDAFPGYALLGSWNDEDSSKAKAREADIVSPPRPKHCEKPEHMLSECDCVGPSPMYANLNDDFYQSIPKPVREIVKMVTGDVAASHDLTRAASMALVLLYRARSQADGGEEAQALLLKQSDLYFQQAVSHLEKAAIPLEAQLIAMADMQLHQFDQAGAAAAYAILLVGEFFITSALGPRPPLDVSTIGEPSRIGLWMFVFADVLRSICLRHQRTVFNFVGLPGEMALAPPGTNVEPPACPQPYSTHLGLPVGLLLTFAATSNLSADMAAGLDPVVALKKADAIEEAIRSWYPYHPDLGMESTTYVDTVATQEMWRQASLIYLYQAVRRRGVLCKKIQTAAQQILQLGARKIAPPTQADPSMYAGSFRACPWFICATCCIEPADRELCRQGLKGCGPQKAYRDNLAAVERIWEMEDAAGWAIDWKEVTERDGIFVAFL